MKKLFLVQLSSWRCHYVMATDFNDAEQKVMRQLERSFSIVTEDGSLQTEPVTIKEIKMLTENVIR